MEISTPEDLLIEQVNGVISCWLSRNWSEVRDGCYPEMQVLTRDLQSLFRSQQGKKR